MQCERSPGGRGGGIFSSGPLTLSDSTVSGNLSGLDIAGFCPPGSAGPNGAPGGGIYTAGSSHFVNSTIFANATPGGGGAGGSHGIGGDGGDGAGIYNTGELSMMNSTVSTNVAAGGGTSSHSGDAGNGGGIFNSGTLTLSHSTVARNRTNVGGVSDIGISPPGVSGVGAGIYNEGQVTLHNTLVGANDAPGDGNDLYGWIDSMDYNLIASVDGYTMTGALGHSWFNVAPHVAELDDNGGATPTHVIQPNSPAVNHGTCTDIHGEPVLLDQRGEPRPQGNACDIGAYEADSRVLFQPVIWR
jgi:hypothetical protein